MDLCDFIKLKERLDKEKESKARLQGKIDVLLQKLAKDFSCDNISEARKLKEKLEKCLEISRADFEARTKEFTSVYGDRIN